MAEERTEQFLDLWRQLENTAEHLVGDGPGSAVLRLCAQPRFAGYRDRLDYCREVRNLLSHQPKCNGEYPVQPGQQVIQLLQEVLERLENPTRLCSVMTPVQKMLVAQPTTPALPLMEKMQQQGISHVPLLRDGRVTVVFSKETVFAAAAQGAALPGREGTLACFAQYLAEPARSKSGYRFVPQDMETARAEEIFQGGTHSRDKIRLLLVTQTGEPNQRLLGVVTPYDLLGD